MGLSDDQIARIVEATRARVGPSPGRGTGPELAASAASGRARVAVAAGGSLGRSLPGGGSTPDAAMHGVFDTLEDAVRAARKAFGEFRRFPLQSRERMIADVRRRLREHVDLLAQLAVEETGLGRVEDKRRKNLLVIEKSPGPEILRPESVSGDHGLMLTEWAPYGTIGAITPVTNPTETVINNGIGMLSAGNTVVFNGHPAAKNVTRLAISLINGAALEAGAPGNLLTTVKVPTLETAQALMAHREIALLVVTGGPGVVRAALDSGKKCITAGPGNPPAVVDETADLPKAAADITAGGSLDNNIVCTAEKLVIVVDAVHDQLLHEFAKVGNYVLRPDEVTRLEAVIFEEMRGPRRKAVINRAFVGKNAQVILAKIGVQVSEACRLAVAPVSNDHPLLWTEQMMPVMPVTSAADADTAIDLAVEMEGRNRHTFVMHSKRVDRLTRMARECDASIFVKNGPNFAGLAEGGEGPTSFTIATPTGEGMTDARSFSRRRRCTLVDDFRIV
jgi:acyl-CoA reductase-like NAD-dependent aldehyde dehydrogenase